MKQTIQRGGIGVAVALALGALLLPACRSTNRHMPTQMSLEEVGQRAKTKAEFIRRLGAPSEIKEDSSRTVFVWKQLDGRGMGVGLGWGFTPLFIWINDQRRSQFLRVVFDQNDQATEVDFVGPTPHVNEGLSPY